MKRYEIVTIYPMSADLKEADNSISKIVEGLGGSVENIDVWGEKKMTYPINDALLGQYITCTVLFPHEHVDELKKQLSFDTTILRSVVLSVE